MEKGFHPVSGEPIFMLSVNEKRVVDVALLQYLSEESTTSKLSGVGND